MTTGTSCRAGGPGLTSCGPSGGENCCTSLEVTGGTYYRTYDSSGFAVEAIFPADGGPTGEADPATVSTFRLDKYEVTVGRFRQFVAAWNGGAGYIPPAGSGKHTYLNGGRGLVNVGDIAGVEVEYETGWVASDDANISPTSANLACTSGGSFWTWTDSAGSQDNLPINCVTWQEAYAFCIWDGGFLPTEAEWEYAAAGGSEQREYPWGTTDPGTTNQYAIYNCNYPTGSIPSGLCTRTGPLADQHDVMSIAPVGTATMGAGLWGHLDLAGSVFEWNLDWAASYVAPCTDCVNLTTNAQQRVIRGGDFYAGQLFLPSPTRDGNMPYIRGSRYGFRCARAP
jgi:sulfatase modifying factor 1